MMIIMKPLNVAQLIHQWISSAFDPDVHQQLGTDPDMWSLFGINEHSNHQFIAAQE